MKTPRLRPLSPSAWLFAIAALASAPRVAAQAVAPSAAQEAPIELSPFTVSTTEDRGYQAQSSLGGSRLKANLKDVASPTTAFTQQFLEDIAVTNLDDLAPFMLSTEHDFGEDAAGQNRLNSSTRPLRVRGINGGTISVNFFKSPYRIDTFNTERIDQSRGPNAVLFGVGDPGGIINVSTKRALLAKPQASVAVVAKSHAGLREEIDVSQPLARDRVAVRVAAVREQNQTWRNYEHDDEHRLFGTLKWRLGAKTELNLDAEQADIDKGTKRSYTALDAYTTWRDGGRVISASPNAAQGIARIATVPWLVYDTATGTLANWRNATASVLRTSIDGDNVALQDFSVLPKQTVVYGPGFYQALGYRRFSAYLTHAFTRELNLELAAMRTDAHIDNSDPQLAAGQALKVDTMPTLPAGGANPNAGRPYFEYLPQRNLNDKRDDSLRANLAYRRDLGRWGRHTIAGVFQHDFAKNSQAVVREQIISPNAPNLATAENNQNRIFRRTYVDLTGPSDRIVMADYRTQNASGVRELVGGQSYTTAWIPFNANSQLNSNDGNTLIGMLQSSFWRDRVQTIIGGSRDRRTDYMSTQRFAPQPGFAQGIRYAIRDHAGLGTKAQGTSFSTVFHATDWLGLTYSQSRNSGLPSFSGVLNPPAGGIMRPPTPKGKSRDMGVKLDLLDHRVFLTVQYFETAAERDFDFIAVMTTNINPIWNALDAAGVLAANRLVLANVQDAATGATFDSKTHGYEAELTANPTERWRIFANYSNETTTRSDIGREQQAYLATYRDLWVRNGSLPTVDGTGRTVAQAVAGVDQAAFSNFVLADGKRPLGQIRHKVNVRSNYDFAREKLKGFSVGGGARWTSAPIVGFTATGALGGPITRRVFYGSTQFFLDANASYRRKLPAVFGKSILWTLQLNLNNVLGNDSFVRLRQASDGQLVNYRWNPPREWIATSRFSF